MTDVTPPPAAPEPAAAQAPAVPAATSTEVAVEAPKKKSGALGGFALILAILAILGDIVVIVFAIGSIVSIASGFDASTFEVSTIVKALGAFAVIAVVGFFGGFIVAALALLLGLIAAIKGRGRVAGVFAIVFSILVLITHGSVALALAQAGQSIGTLTSVVPS